MIQAPFSGTAITVEPMSLQFNPSPFIVTYNAWLSFGMTLVLPSWNDWLCYSLQCKKQVDMITNSDSDTVFYSPPLYGIHVQSICVSVDWYSVYAWLVKLGPLSALIALLDCYSFQLRTVNYSPSNVSSWLLYYTYIHVHHHILTHPGLPQHMYIAVVVFQQVLIFWHLSLIVLHRNGYLYNL